MYELVYFSEWALLEIFINSFVIISDFFISVVHPSGLTIFVSKPEFEQNFENLFDWNKCCHELKSVMKCSVIDICPSLQGIQLSSESEEFNESCDGVRNVSTIIKYNI